MLTLGLIIQKTKVLFISRRKHCAYCRNTRKFQTVSAVRKNEWSKKKLLHPVSIFRIVSSH